MEIFDVSDNSMKIKNNEVEPNVIRWLWAYLPRHRKLQFFYLLILVVVGALLEVGTLGSIMPFITALVMPKKLFSDPAVHHMALAWGISHPRSLLLPFTIFFIVFALFSGVVRLVMIWGISRYSAIVGADIGSNVFKQQLYRPYGVLIRENSSNLISGLTKITEVTEAFRALLLIPSALAIVLAITVALLVINPVMAVTSAFVLGGCYFIISRVLKYKLNENGKIISISASKEIKVVNEAVGGIRDIILDGTQKAYCSIYDRHSRLHRLAISNNEVMGVSPRYGMEAIGMVMIATLAFLMTILHPKANILPFLAALAVGAQRLLPMLQQTYQGWAIYRGRREIIVNIIHLMGNEIDLETVTQDVPPLKFKDKLLFSNVGFRYQESSSWVLRHLNLELSKGGRYGFVGSTGSGKSTLMDLVMGLLEPIEGSVLIDGKELAGIHKQAWQRNIAHVPQSIFLSDASFTENIAFGVPLERVDHDRVREAACMAQINEFIESLPNHYDERVGERGIRLSGGQRQRIGIARALYKKAQVLIFDEATSALDNLTEKSLMEAIRGLSRDLTVLIIAHRLTTIRDCDHIIVLERGRVEAVGGYNDLKENNSVFRQLSNIG